MRSQYARTFKEVIMDKRKEYRKTVVFKSEEEKEQFEAIVDVECAAQHKNPSEFLISVIEDTFLPRNEIACLWCKKLYMMNDPDKNVYDVLADIFIFLSGVTEIDQYSKNAVLVHYMSLITDKDIELEKGSGSFDRFKKNWDSLSEEVLEEVSSDLETEFTKIENRLKKDNKPFKIDLILQLVTDEYNELSISPYYYKALSYFCMMLSNKKSSNKVEERLALIRCLKVVSRYWDDVPSKALEYIEDYEKNLRKDKEDEEDEVDEEESEFKGFTRYL